MLAKKKALEGIKVADFSWVIVGPMVTKHLADCGATVVKVESSAKPDVLRAYVPMAQGVPGINRCGAFTANNDSKYSMTLNLNVPEGIAVARKLVAWADIVVENYSPGTMEKWGLGYDDIRKFNPGVIMLRLTMQGQTGPRASQGGFGTLLASLAGFTEVTGYPDSDPAGIPTGYTDFIAPWYTLVVLIAALDRRRQTGKGMFIDCSQFEAALSFLSPAVLDYTVNGRIQTRDGNRCPYAVPHGVYRCRGEDRWCAIAVFDDEEWHTFCKAMGELAWTRDSRFATFLGRKKNEPEIDRLVESWTINLDPEEVMTRLQKAGIAAGAVQNGKDLHNDPQLKARRHFWFLRHPEIGLQAYDAPAYRLSKTPAELTMPAPCLGEHTEYVCREILKIADEDFTQLLAKGVFE